MTLLTIDPIDHVAMKHVILSSILISITVLGMTCTLVPFMILILQTLSTARQIELFVRRVINCEFLDSFNNNSQSTFFGIF